MICVDHLDHAALIEIARAARDLLYAMDRGFLAYEADEPECAFVAGLRKALEGEGVSIPDDREELPRAAE